MQNENTELKTLLGRLEEERENEKKEERRRKRLQKQAQHARAAISTEGKKKQRKQVIEININEGKDVIIEDEDEQLELDIEEAISKLEPTLQEYANLLRDDLVDYYALAEETKPEKGYKSGASEMAPAGHQWVYVFLVNSRTPMSKVIKHFTKQPYNHASLSFDKSLTNMYSFTMAQAHGFTKENVYNYNKEAEFSLYKIAVPNNAVAAMKDAINNVEKFQVEYKYSTKGLLGFVFKRHQDKFNTKEKAMFCSQFVARMFATAGMKITDKNDYEIRPYDFARNKNFKFCYRGSVTNFDPTKVR